MVTILTFELFLQVMYSAKGESQREVASHEWLLAV